MSHFRYVNRRDILRGISGASLAAATTGSLGAALSGMSATASSGDGYKAIVCVFLLGGIDNYDVMLPYDQPSYDAFAAIRQPLYSRLDNQPEGNNRVRDRLLALNPLNAADFGGRQFALPEEFSGLHGLFEDGRAAIVGNVGPLLEPASASLIDADSVALPPRLFSHNDQQSTWITGLPEGATRGYGGRILDPLLTGIPDADRFAAMTTNGQTSFLTGQFASPFQIAQGGADESLVLSFLENSGDLDALAAAVRRQLTSETFVGTNLIERDVAAANVRAAATNAEYNAALAAAPVITTAFPDSSLGQQLLAITEAISARGSLGATRQVFIAATGGFDTHSDQATTLPGLERGIDAAIVAFQAAMEELGVSDQVTLFTASDFGRSLVINGDGTDHGWGAHHFVVGGAVQGQRIFGTVPPMTLGHEYDAGSGRLIPTTSVEQMMAPMAEWFGLSPSEIAAALPVLNQFPEGPLTGLLA